MKKQEDKNLLFFIKFQDSNVAIIRFSKKELAKIREKTTIYAEAGIDFFDHFDEEYAKNSNVVQHLFFQSFEEALNEINGVLFAMVDGYEIVVVKDPSFPNWGRMLEDVIWTSLIFIGADSAVQVSKKGDKTIGKLIACNVFV